MMTMRKTNGSMPRRPEPGALGEAAGVCARKRKSMAVTGCQFVALAVNHVQSRTSGFLESTGAPKMQGAELFQFAPARFFELDCWIVDLAAVDLLVLVGNVGPRSEAKRDAIARAHASCRRQNVVAHALGIYECFHSWIFFAAFDCEIGEVKRENVVFVGDGAGTRDG